RSSGDGRAETVRIVHCIHGLGLGGAQQVVKLIAQHADRGVFEHLVYSPADGVSRPDIEEVGARVRVVERAIPKLDPTWVAGLPPGLGPARPAVVHPPLFGASLHAYRASRLAGSPPMVMTLHIGMDGSSALQQRGYRWLLSRTARNVACSE